MKLKDTIYLTSQKELMMDKFNNICKENGIDITESSKILAGYACYEVGINVEWDTNTGKCKILGIEK